jgi:hypothetical protein
MDAVMAAQQDELYNCMNDNYTWTHSTLQDGIDGIPRR